MNESLKKRLNVQQKAVQNLSQKFQGIIDVAPRVGKTKIAIDLLKLYQGKYVVLLPDTTVRDTWLAECTKWNFDVPEIHLFASIKKVTDPQLILIDEIHCLSDNQILLVKEIQQRTNCAIIGMTGSLNEDVEENLYTQLKVKKVYTYSIEEAIKDKIIADYEIYVHKIPLDNLKKVYETKGGKLTEKEYYKQLTSRFEYFRRESRKNKDLDVVKMQFASKRATMLYESESKIKAVQKLLVKLKKEKVLIFTTRIGVAEQLSSETYHGKSTSDEYYQWFKTSKDGHLAVVKLANAGVTFNNLKVGVIHQLQSNDMTAIQRILRMMNYDKGKIAQIHIFVYEGTVDEDWVKKALNQFDETKIQYL